MNPPGARRAYARSVRSVGGAQHAGGFGVQDHLSWPYDDRADFLQRVHEFLRSGLELGLRCVYVADGPRERLISDLSGLPDLQGQIERGALEISVLTEMYPGGARIDPRENLATFSAATERALAHGYSGLRVAGDSTPLVRSPEQVAAFAQWEHLADRYMSEHPFSAMCGFDRRGLPAAATLALACLHPAAREGMTTFQLYAAGERGDIALAGELDMSVSEVFRVCLDRTRVDCTNELVVDGARLGFVDHRALLSLRDFAVRSGATVVLRTPSDMPARLIELLELDGIRAEPVPTEGVPA